MSAVFGRRSRRLDSGRRGWRWGPLSATLLAVAVVGTAAARADNLTVAIDSARLLRLPTEVATVVIGNPLIADASLQRGGVLVITGKGYGTTNLLALDRSGRVVLDKTVRVKGPSHHNDLVVVYRGMDRESYSCAPQCEPRITLGDSNKYFAGTMGQTAARDHGAQSGGGGGGGGGGFGAGSVEMTSSGFKDTILGEATYEASSSVASKLAAAHSRVPTHKVEIHGLVAYAEGGTVIVNVGTNSGVEVGTELDVERVKQTIKDPATGRVLRELTAKVARIRITQADADSSEATVVSGEGIKTGDIVRN
ncbi:MAG: pilus assembly protein N-terminal domain-containing protein [Pseudolabrys sp.]